jgi:hypothetical protein
MTPRVQRVAALAMLLASSGCYDSGAVLARDDGGPADADDARVFIDVGAPRPQPCTDGIRRFDVDGIPALEFENQGSVRVQLAGDEVLVALSDFATDSASHTSGRFVRVAAASGTILATGVQEIADAVALPEAIRSLPDGSVEVLFRLSPTEVVVARYGSDGAPLGSSPLTIPSPFGSASFGFDAVATESGFFVVIHIVGVGSLAAFDVREGVASPIMLPVDGEEMRGAWDTSVATSDGHVIWIADDTLIRPLQILRLWRLDLREPSRAPSYVELSAPLEDGHQDVFSVRGASDGTALVLATSLERLSMFWIGADLTRSGDWTSTTETTVGDLIGVAGAIPDQAIAFWNGGVGGVRFARAYAPGDLGGGLDPVVDAAMGNVAGAPDDAAENADFGVRSDGTFTLAWWAGGLSIATFCQPR